jgi:hypothetical protein
MMVLDTGITGPWRPRQEAHRVVCDTPSASREFVLAGPLSRNSRPFALGSTLLRLPASELGVTAA